MNGLPGKTGGRIAPFVLAGVIVALNQFGPLATEGGSDASRPWRHAR
jgi:hypothetical protein